MTFCLKAKDCHCFFEFSVFHGGLWSSLTEVTLSYQCSVFFLFYTVVAVLIDLLLSYVI